MSYSALIIVAVALATILVWLFWPYSIITYEPPTDYPIVAGVDSENNVEQGGAIVYAFDYQKETDIIPEVNRRFIDGLVFQAAEGAIDLPRGRGRALVETPIPETLPPGTYYLEITRTFKMNPIRKVEIVSRTETFTVTPKED